MKCSVDEKINLEPVDVVSVETIIKLAIKPLTEKKKWIYTLLNKDCILKGLGAYTYEFAFCNSRTTVSIQ